MSISRIYGLLLSALLISAVLVGCNNSPSTSDDKAHEMKSTDTSGEVDAEITAALAELSEEDRIAAEAQKFCVVAQESRLGSMGTPFKLMIDGQPVFLCCEGCKDGALKDPQATLAAVAQLKQSNSSPK
jgi:hypothetical protein